MGDMSVDPSANTTDDGTLPAPGTDSSTALAESPAVDPAPSADTTPTADTGAPTPIAAPDVAKANAAKGDPAIWAEVVTDYVSNATGSHFSLDDFAVIFTAFAHQVRVKESRDLAFLVANLSLPTDMPEDTDVAFQLVDFRNEIFQVARKRAES